jgi:hypothetical protein
MKSLPSKGDTVKMFCATPIAVTLDVVSAVTKGVAAVWILKVADEEPAKTFTLAGTITNLGRLLLKLMAVPPCGAGFSNVIRAMTVSPFRA